MKKIFKTISICAICFCLALGLAACDKNQIGDESLGIDDLAVILTEQSEKLDRLQNKIADLDDKCDDMSDRIESIQEQSEEIAENQNGQWYTITYDYNNPIFNDYVDMNIYFWGYSKTRIIYDGQVPRYLPESSPASAGVGEIKGWRYKDTDEWAHEGDAIKGDVTLVAVWETDPTSVYFLRDLNYIPRGLYADNDNITDVYLPYCLRTIEDSAFADCSNLKNVYGYAHFGKVVVGDYAFFGCRELEYIAILGSNVSQVGKYAFYCCDKMVVSAGAVSGIEEIGDYAFYACENICGSFYITQGNKWIGDLAFAHCNGLTEVKIYADVDIGETVFAFCDGILSIYIEQSVTSDINIVSTFFNSCHNIVEIVNRANLELNLEKIEYSSIGKDGLLFIVDIYGHNKGEFTESNGVVYYENNNVSPNVPKTVVAINDTSIKNVIIDNDCVNIYDWSRHPWTPNSSTVESISIPDSVIHIGSNAFAGFVSLETVSIGAGVTNIESQAFWGCESLNTIIIDSATVANNLIDSDSQGELICRDATVYIKTELETTNSTYLIENFTKQATSDKDGYDMWVKIS